MTEHFDTRIVGGDIFEAANCDKSVEMVTMGEGREIFHVGVILDQLYTIQIARLG